MFLTSEEMFSVYTVCWKHGTVWFYRFICFNLLVWYRCSNTWDCYSCSFIALISLSSSELSLLSFCFVNIHWLSAGHKPGHDVSLNYRPFLKFEKTFLIKYINNQCVKSFEVIYLKKIMFFWTSKKRQKALSFLPNSSIYNLIWGDPYHSSCWN